MKRRMEQLVNGRFEYEVPRLALSVREVNLTTGVGENCRDEFYIGAKNGRRVKGVLTTTNRRIVLGREKFAGDVVGIPYGIDVMGLNDGDTVEGEIVIQSDLEEQYIPVTVKVQADNVRSSFGEVCTLDDFTRLAQRDYREAFYLFTSERFAGLLKGDDARRMALYRGMSQNPVTYQHMEEFLIAAEKKEAVKLEIRRKGKASYRLERSLKDTLPIARSTWGYVRAEVEVCGDFLEVEKHVITSEDFIGSIYGMEYIVRREKIGAGRHYGKIILRSVYQTLEYEIEASIDNGIQEVRGFVASHLKVDMTQDYLALCLGKMDQEEWGRRTAANLKQFEECGSKEVMMDLYAAYVAYKQGESYRALELLFPYRDYEFGPGEEEEQGVYLYLAKYTELLPVEKRDISVKLYSLQKRRPDSFLLLELFLTEDEEFKNAPAKQLYRMEKLFEIGSTSPFLYLAACGILIQDDGMLCKLSDFMIQVLRFALRHDILTEALVERAAYLSGHEKTFRRSLYRLLGEGYQKFGGNDVLEAVCRLIMLGRPTDRQYFKWYALAVEKELRLTRLYEYYIETMGEDFSGVLPQVIRMYFAYNNTLGSRKRAFIYANVIRNKEVDRTTYQSYKKAMEQFAAEQLKKRRMNEDYAVIYQECIPRLTDAATADAMADVMFVHRLTCQDRSIRKVIVCHEALRDEAVYPCTDGVAYISLYTPGAQILFEDEKRRRFASTVPYQVEKLMDIGEYVKECAALDVDNPGFLLHLCKESQMKVGIRSLNAFRRAAENEIFTEEYRQKVRRCLLDYYMAHAGEDMLDGYLAKLDYEAFARVDKVALVEILIDRRMYAQAFDIICDYGYENVRVGYLLRLCSRQILNAEYEENEELIYLAHYVFSQGKYDEVILTYLRDHYAGPVDEMCAVWERVKGFGLESYYLDERILVYSMFVRRYPKQGARVLESYVSQQGRELVIMAFLTYEACGYFMGAHTPDPVIFEFLEAVYDREWEMDRICRLALLKHDASLPELTEKQEQQAARLLEEFIQQNLRFAFYQKLPAQLIKSYQLEDKIFVEEKLPAAARVTIHYRMERQGEPVQEYKSEPMKNMYQGIFGKEFLLFYGETLRYHMTVEVGEDSYDTEEKTVTLQEISTAGASRYQLLNQMLCACALGQKDDLHRAMQRYLMQEKLTETVFSILD